MKMEPIMSSETSAIRTQTPGNYPKRNNLQHFKCFNVNFRLLKTIYVHLLVCYLNRLHNARCNDKDSVYYCIT